MAKTFKSLRPSEKNNELILDREYAIKIKRFDYLKPVRDHVNSIPKSENPKGAKVGALAFAMLLDKKLIPMFKENVLFTRVNTGAPTEVKAGDSTFKDHAIYKFSSPWKENTCENDALNKTFEEFDRAKYPLSTCIDGLVTAEHCDTVTSCPLFGSFVGGLPNDPEEILATARREGTYRQDGNTPDPQLIQELNETIQTFKSNLYPYSAVPDFNHEKHPRIRSMLMNHANDNVDDATWVDTNKLNEINKGINAWNAHTKSNDTTCNLYGIVDPIKTYVDPVNEVQVSRDTDIVGAHPFRIDTNQFQMLAAGQTGKPKTLGSDTTVENINTLPFTRREAVENTYLIFVDGDRLREFYSSGFSGSNTNSITDNDRVQLAKIVLHPVTYKIAGLVSE